MTRFGPSSCAGLDRLARVDVEPVLLAHDPERRGARVEVAAQVVGHAERLPAGLLAELAELVAAAGHDGEVRVRVDQARHDEGRAEVDHLRALRGRPGDDLPAVDDDLAPRDRVGAGAVEERPATDDDAHAGTRCVRRRRAERPRRRGPTAAR